MLTSSTRFASRACRSATLPTVSLTITPWSNLLVALLKSPRSSNSPPPPLLVSLTRLPLYCFSIANVSPYQQMSLLSNLPTLLPPMSMSLPSLVSNRTPLLRSPLPLLCFLSTSPLPLSLFSALRFLPRQMITLTTSLPTTLVTTPPTLSTTSTLPFSLPSTSSSPVDYLNKSTMINWTVLLNTFSRRRRRILGSCFSRDGESRKVLLLPVVKWWPRSRHLDDF